MTRLEIVLSLILFLSTIFNVGVFVYARSAIMRLITFAEELGDLRMMISSFTSHLKSIYELETFYGDQTLQGLLEHAVSFNDQMETFEYIYGLIEKEQQELDEQDDEEEEDSE
jgi:hypothetical protein